MAKKTTTDFELARKVWLAGIGAYGKAIGTAIEGAQSAYDKVETGSSRIFKELVSEGEAVEEKFYKKLSTLKSDKSADAKDGNLEQRMQRMKTILGLDEMAHPDRGDDRIQAIEKRLTLIEQKLETVVGLLGAGGGTATQKKKAPSKRQAKKKLTKSATKKRPTGEIE